MDYETKIYLDKLTEAVEELNSPDWWSIAATFFAAVVAAGITWHLGKRQNKLQQQQVEIQKRQNELQEEQTRLQEQQNNLQEVQTDLMKQQTKAQEYNIYRGLYEMVNSIHIATAGFVMKMYGTIVPKDNIKIYSLDSIREEIANLKNDLSRKTIDVELKFPNDYHRCESYKFILALMETAVNRIDAIEKQGLINVYNLIDVQTIVSDINKGDKHLLGMIQSCISEGAQRKELIDTLIAISTLYEEVCDSAFLEKIKSKI